MAQFWAPIGPRPPPRIAGSAGSVVTPLIIAARRRKIPGNHDRVFLQCVRVKSRLIISCRI